MSFDFYKEVHEIEVELTRNGYSDLEGSWLRIL